MYAMLLNVLVVTVSAAAAGDGQAPAPVTEDFDHVAGGVAGCCSHGGRPVSGCVSPCHGTVLRPGRSLHFSRSWGNHRHGYCYPDFSTYYSHRRYNYLHAFDYPWHPTTHRPMELLTYPRGGQLWEEIRKPPPSNGAFSAESADSLSH